MEWTGEEGVRFAFRATAEAGRLEPWASWDRNLLYGGDLRFFQVQIAEYTPPPSGHEDATVSWGWNYEKTETSEYLVKEVTHFADRYRQLQKSHYFIRFVGIGNWRTISLVLDTAAWGGMFGLIYAPPQMAIIYDAVDEN